MDNLQQSQQNLENDSLTFEMDIVRTSIALAFSRTGTEFDKDLANNIFLDAIDTFPNLRIEQFAEALKLGSLGEYGKTYKLTVQEVCIWIRTYKRDRTPKFCYE